MKINDFIKIIRALNNGNVIYDKNDKDTEIFLGSDLYKVYTTNDKFYFLAEYELSENGDNIAEIEYYTLENQEIKNYENRLPNNSYLILFYEIDAVTEKTLKTIIKLEENEFNFKKYVFYYTTEEFKAYENWILENKHKNLIDILKTDNLNTEFQEKHIQFLLRLIIKVPFLKMEFPKMKMEDFGNLLDTQLQGLRSNKSETIALYNELNGQFDILSIEKISEKLFNEILAGDEDED